MGMVAGDVPEFYKLQYMQIPTDAGQIFRGDAGRDSDLKPDAIPR